MQEPRPKMMRSRRPLRHPALWGLFLVVVQCLASPLLAEGEPGDTGPAGDLKELARRAMVAVVRLEVLDRLGNEQGSGTGFFVSPEGWLVTNHHVIEGAQRVVASLADGERLEITGVLAVDEENDLAVLATTGERFSALPLARSSLDVEIGEGVVVFGGPLGLAGTLSDGIVAAVRRPGDRALGRDETFEVARLQITAAISPGSSGSPVLNLDGEVLGVVVSQAVFGQNLNFAVPIEAVRALLGGIGTQTEARQLTVVTGASSSAVLRNLGISAVFFVLLAVGYRRLTQG